MSRVSAEDPSCGKDLMHECHPALRPRSERRLAGRWIFACLCLTASCAILFDNVPAQVMGDEAELTRLRNKAEDAMAADDPDGAAMMMGRAALLSAQMAKKREGISGVVSRRMESLFRSQEHTYRAMSLFRRAGNQLPASSGVCGSLSLALTSLRQAAEPIGDLPSPPPTPRLPEDVAQLTETVETWMTVVASMIAEYQCP
ncbi:hypothetical protein ACO9S2_01340 [Nitrospira sp. NS4]|uniref:hypothetical protein n=1 Tax=Nitrospira sp. NS4 TaxID=3414498 RepID=UPI003C2C545B